MFTPSPINGSEMFLAAALEQLRAIHCLLEQLPDRIASAYDSSQRIAELQAIRAQLDQLPDKIAAACATPPGQTKKK